MLYCLLSVGAHRLCAIAGQVYEQHRPHLGFASVYSTLFIPSRHVYSLFCTDVNKVRREWHAILDVYAVANGFPVPPEVAKPLLRELPNNGSCWAPGPHFG